MRRVSGIWAWSPAAAYAGLIFFLSSIPAKSMPAGRFWDFDKIIHAVEYMVLATLLWFAFTRTVRLAPRRLAAAVFILCTLYGASDELHQSFVPGRASSWGDVLADAFGALVVCAVLVLWRGRDLER